MSLTDSCPSASSIPLLSRPPYSQTMFEDQGAVTARANDQNTLSPSSTLVPATILERKCGRQLHLLRLGKVRIDCRSRPQYIIVGMRTLVLLMRRVYPSSRKHLPFPTNKSLPCFPRTTTRTCPCLRSKSRILIAPRLHSGPLVRHLQEWLVTLDFGTVHSTLQLVTAKPAKKMPIS